MRNWPRMGSRVACALMCAGAAFAADPSHPKSPAQTPGIATAGYVYFNGRLVSFRTASAAHRNNVLVGPWRVGIRSYSGKPRDGRPNLYIVVPGHQHHLEGFEAYDHNQVISGIPASGNAVDWDVWWALILDPRMREDFRSESELLMATQQTFALAESAEFDDIPCARFLQRVLKVESVGELDRFRRHDKRLPRLVILPAGFAIRAVAGAEPAK